MKATTIAALSGAVTGISVALFQLFHGRDVASNPSAVGAHPADCRRFVSDGGWILERLSSTGVLRETGPDGAVHIFREMNRDAEHLYLLDEQRAIYQRVPLYGYVRVAWRTRRTDYEGISSYYIRCADN